LAPQGEGLGLDGRPLLAGEDDRRSVAGGGVGADELVKEGLRKPQGLRREWARAQREAGERQRRLQAVAEDQARLRANLREVPQSSPLHRRYLDKLGRQEDEVEKHRAEVKRLQAQGHAPKHALDDFLTSLSADSAYRDGGKTYQLRSGQPGGRRAPRGSSIARVPAKDRVNPSRSSNCRTGSGPAPPDSWPGDGPIASGVPKKSLT
jgi:hypothetical protein